MSTQEIKQTPEQENQPREKGYEIKELIKRGKAKGTLSQSEIMEALEDVDYDIEQIEKLYETLENMGIEITGYMDSPDFDLLDIQRQRAGLNEHREVLRLRSGKRGRTARICRRNGKDAHPGRSCHR